MIANHRRMRTLMLFLAVTLGACNDGDCGDCAGTCNDGRCYVDTCSFPHSYYGDSGGACSAPGESCTYDTWEWTFECTCVAPEGVLECAGGFGSQDPKSYCTAAKAGEPCATSPAEGCPPTAEEHPGFACTCDATHHWRCDPVALDGGTSE
jgi:hypothetical protein